MTANPHPLDPATAGEYLAGREIMAAAGLLADPVRFAYYGLAEPAKDEVLGSSFQPGTVGRRLRAFLLNLKTGESTDVVVSLTDRSVVSARTVDTAAEGQLPIIDSEYHLVEEIMAADPDWQAAMARRGLTDMSKIRIAPITAGAFRAPAEDDERRMVRVLAFLQAREHDLAWAHPVDGVTAHVDLIAKQVLRVIDEFELPVPAESGDYDDPAVRGPERTTLRPIEITQPEGPSFTVEGSLLRWQDWSLRVGFDAREGLTLHQIELAGRPVIYRASVPEMVVPYGDPRFRYWQAYFDTGEYLVGQWVNSLELGCDCLGEIAYLDAVVCGETGEPREVRNAICVHEEDFGILWKHTDIFNGSAQSRRQRRLVVSYFTTVGNYDYGFYWYFYLDGTIECEVKMTGIVFTAGHPGGDHPYSTEVAPGLGAPVHQHLFSARLDMSVDGLANAVEEVDVTGLPIGPDNPYGNAIAQRVTRLTSEASAARSGDAAHGRVWRVLSTESTNRFGQPVAFTLHPEPAPPLLADPDSPLAARAAFASRALWVTRYDPAQRYPAGDFVNQSPGGGGLPAYVAADRDIDGQDIVVWHTFGPTHVVRTEDWPVMPVTRTGFMLRPTGFFDRNPTLDVPAPSGHCDPDQNIELYAFNCRAQLFRLVCETVISRQVCGESGLERLPGGPDTLNRPHPSHRQQKPRRGGLAAGAGVAAALAGLGVAVAVGAVPSPLTANSAKPLDAATLAAVPASVSDSLLQASASPLGFATAKMPAPSHKASPKSTPSHTATPTQTPTATAPSATQSSSQPVDPGGLTPQATAEYETPTGENEKAWSEAILNALGAPLTSQNIVSIGYWMQNEAGTQSSGGIVGANNPINVSQSCCGGVPIQDDGDGVTFLQSYPTVADGVEATAEYLNRGNYTQILADLKAGDGLMSDSSLSSEISLYSGGGYSAIPDSWGASQGTPLS